MFLFVSIIVSLLPVCSPTACAVGNTEVHEFEVRVSGFTCYGIDIAGGVYVDTGNVWNHSLVYYRAEPEPRYMYRQREEWYISKKFNDVEYELKFAGCQTTPQTVQELAEDTEFRCDIAMVCGEEVRWNPQGSLEAALLTRCACSTQFVRTNDGSGVCVECPRGSYKLLLEVGESGCRTCPANSDTLNASFGIDGCGCNAGYMGPNTGGFVGPIGKCTKCDLGKYKPDTGAGPCIKCASDLHPLHNAFAVENAVLNCNVCQISFAWNAQTQQCDPCASDEFNNEAGDSVCFKCVATPPFVPLTDSMMVWHKFDQDPPAWGPGIRPRYQNRGMIYDSSGRDSHGYFVWNVFAYGQPRDPLNREFFVQGDASLSSSSGHPVVLGSMWLGVDTSILFYFRCVPGGHSEMLFMPVHWGIHFAITRKGNGLQFLFVHDHVPRTYFVTDGHEAGGFQNFKWYHLAWVMEGSRNRWSIYIDGERIPVPLDNPWQPYRDLPYMNNRVRGGGQIDDFRIYHRGLTAREVQTVHKQRDPYEVCGATESNGTTCPRLCRVHAGYELTPSGANTKPCPANSYQDGWGVHCVPCPLGTSTNATGNENMAACECDPGYAREISDQGKCELCESGKFKAAHGTAPCTTCAANEFSDPGSLQCGCNAGYTGIPLTSCQACAAGTYKNSTGSAACLSCEKYRSSPVGSREKLDCTCIHGYMGFDDGTCASSHTCPLHADKPWGALRTLCRCNAGYTGYDMHGPCVGCDVGKFKDTKGTDLCKSCSPDSNTVTTGNAFQVSCGCNAGSTGNNGEQCTKCGVGKYKHDPGPEPCTFCPSGTVSALGSTMLEECICDLGFTGPGGLACTACVQGKYKEYAGAGECTPCDRFSDSQSNSRSRLDCICDQGYRRNDVDAMLPDTQADVAERKTGLAGWRLVRFMPQRESSATWYRMCDLLQGFITVGVAYDNTTDWTIPFGEFDQFLFGTYDLAHWLLVPKSSTIAFSAYGDNDRPVISSSVNPYPHSANMIIGIELPGEHRPAIYLTQSFNEKTVMYKEGIGGGNAHAHMTLSNGGMGVWVRHSNPAWCRICAANTYKIDIRAAVCSDCPAGSRAAAGSTSRLACICRAGYIGPPGGPCVACAGGTYQPQDGAQLCLRCAQYAISLPASVLCQCSAGSVGPDNGACITCPVNTFARVPGSSSCQTCPENTTSSAGSFRCRCHTYLHGTGTHEMPPIPKTPLVFDVPRIPLGIHPWLYRTEYEYALPPGYNKVSVMARNYRAENGASVALTGVALRGHTAITPTNGASVALTGVVLQNFAVGGQQRCGTATIVTTDYNPGDSLRVTENWHAFWEELYIVVALEARGTDSAVEPVDCIDCPPGYFVFRQFFGWNSSTKDVAQAQYANETCMACPVDTYNPSSVSGFCYSCPPDTHAPAASSDKKDCKCRGARAGDAGLMGPGGGPCQACPAQHYKAQSGGGWCDRITDASKSVSFPHALGTPVRSILARGFRGSWLPGDQVHVQQGGRRGTNDVILTYSTGTAHTDYHHWTPPNMQPLLRLHDTFRFYIPSSTLLQINASESGFALRAA